ncbi:hypothetical protein [uncultured Lentibacter sp.]|uniref:hypothetical protein n=1 Tax=uncultured Lentibacter sp. TaxID=1659309 RepID=UPI00262D9460|nr:hypothetical protein [uncultured Lentibacter sp.]
MSDPVTNVEIEDVLSSIRRLVSESGGAAHQRAAAHPPSPTPGELAHSADSADAGARAEVPQTGFSQDAEPQADQDSGADIPVSDKLVLTPAQRVSAPNPDSAPEQDTAPEQPSAAEPAMPENTVPENMPPEDAAPEDTAPEDTAPEDTAPEAAAPEMAGSDAAEQQEEARQEDAPDAAESASDTGAEPVSDAATEQSLKARLETLESAVSNQVENWEDVSENALPWEDLETPDSAVFGLAGYLEDDTPPQANPAPDTAEQSAQEDPAQDDPAQDEPAQDEPAPEDPAPEDPAPKDPALADPAQTGPHAPDRDAAPGQNGGTGFDFLEGDETLLDEDMLREMVAEIVRQELQGALGERITRNVRKLVRREIHRALIAQDLE